MGSATTETGKGLVVWGGGSAAPLRARVVEGARIVAWPGAPVATLAGEGVAFRPAEDVLGPEGLAAVEAAGKRFARVWGRLPLADGKSFHDLVIWRGASLLWSAEAFLLDQTAGARCARTAELALRLLETTTPAEVDALALPSADALLLARAATASGVLFHGPVAGAVRPLPVAVPRRAGRLGRLLAYAWARAAAPLPPAPVAGPRGPGPILAVVATAAERAARAPLWTAIAAALARGVVVVALAELFGWQTRRVHRAVAESAALLRACGRRVRGTPALAESYAHRGVGFADLATRDLAALLEGRLLAAARLVETGIELLASARPAALLVSGSSSDDRRALVHASHATGVPAVVLLHAGAGPLRDDGGPRPAAAVAWDSPEGVIPPLRDVLRGRVEAR